LKAIKPKRNTQASLDVVVVEVEPLDTQSEEPHEAKLGKMKKGKQVPKIPSKPNRKTRLINQLRLNTKAFFNSSLKEHKKQENSKPVQARSIGVRGSSPIIGIHLAPCKVIN
jgi:hypothetical protein